MTAQPTNICLITTSQFLEHWLGHRRLTRKVIAAFPADQLFTFSIGGMRSFGAMACEILGMAVPTIQGLTTGEWSSFQTGKPATQEEVLQQWDEQTATIRDTFPNIPAEAFPRVQKAFGQWESDGLAMVQYVLDNEIHHRAQGVVYLRALGITPPNFWERD